MKNITQILRINGYEKFFKEHERHLMLADPWHVKRAYNYHREREKALRPYMKDDESQIRLDCSIPMAWHFHPELSKKVSTAKMDKNERADYFTAFTRVFDGWKSKQNRRYV